VFVLNKGKESLKEFILKLSKVKQLFASFYSKRLKNFIKFFIVFLFSEPVVDIDTYKRVFSRSNIVWQLNGGSENKEIVTKIRFFMNSFSSMYIENLKLYINFYKIILFYLLRMLFLIGFNLILLMKLANIENITHHIVNKHKIKI
jgi:hypothetical protein